MRPILRWHKELRSIGEWSATPLAPCATPKLIPTLAGHFREFASPEGARYDSPGAAPGTRPTIIAKPRRGAITGRRTITRQSPTGRNESAGNPVSRPFRAIGCASSLFPGAAPRAVISRPFGAVAASLRTSHAVAAVVAEVAVAVADGDRAAVVATGGVGLERGELLAAERGGRRRRRSPAGRAPRWPRPPAPPRAVAARAVGRAAVRRCPRPCGRRWSRRLGRSWPRGRPAGLRGGGPPLCVSVSRFVLAARRFGRRRGIILFASRKPGRNVMPSQRKM